MYNIKAGLFSVGPGTCWGQFDGPARFAIAEGRRGVFLLVAEGEQV